MLNPKNSKLFSTSHTGQENIPPTHINTVAARSTATGDAFSRSVGQNLLDGQESAKIITYSTKAPEPAPFDHRSKFELAAPKPQPRAFTPQPIENLKAPFLSDDFNHNVISWSSQNLVAVALAGSVYLFDLETRETSAFIENDDVEWNISSIKWDEGGKYLSVALEDGVVEIWDVTTGKRLRKIKQHADTVNAMAWKEFMLTCGSMDTNITNNDLRCKDPLLSTYTGHTGLVCGLQWSPSGQDLASGSSDHSVKVWDAATNKLRMTLTESRGTTKALSWCQWKEDTLAVGGGQGDGTIRIYNTAVGTMQHSVATGAQVCSIHFALNDKDVISTHGFANSTGNTPNRFSIWRYPTLVETYRDSNYNDRLLFSDISPDGTSVAVAEPRNNLGDGGSIYFLKTWESLEEKQARMSGCGGNGPKSKSKIR